jgi:hypothetical protein
MKCLIKVPVLRNHDQRRGCDFSELLQMEPQSFILRCLQYADKSVSIFLFFKHLFIYLFYLLLFFNGSTALVGLGRFYLSFLIYTRAVGLLERVISSSQGLYPNTRQHKHRKTHIHTPLNIHAPKAGFEPAIAASK